MPYTGADDPKIPDHVPRGKRAQWAAVWNRTYEACQKAGGDDCEARAFRAANGVIKENKAMKTAVLIENINLTEAEVNAESRTVDVVLIRPGWSANGRYYSPDVLAKAAPLFEGVKAYANHPSIEQLRRGEPRSVLEITGQYTNVHIGPGGELRATREVFGEAGERVWPLIVRSVEGKRPVIGLSINAVGKAAPGEIDGRKGIIVEDINAANSVDDVTEPAAGGGYTALVAGVESLAQDILEALDFEEWTVARPDFVERLKREWKQVRQDEAVAAAVAERDQARRALVEAERQVDTLRKRQAEQDAEIARLRAEIVRKGLEVELERALREAALPVEWENELRKQLEQAGPDQWPGILEAERRKARAARNVRITVPVTSAPRREHQPTLVESRPGPLNMDVLDTPEKLQAELARRARRAR